MAMTAVGGGQGGIVLEQVEGHGLGFEIGTD